MNKKGFTLIELLATIVIIAIIMALVFPAALKMRKNNEGKICDEYRNMMVEYARVSSKKNESYIDLSELEELQKVKADCDGYILVDHSTEPPTYKALISCNNGCKDVEYAEIEERKDNVILSAKDVTINYLETIPSFEYDVRVVSFSNEEINDQPLTSSVSFIIKNSSGEVVDINSNLPTGKYKIIPSVSVKPNYRLTIQEGTLTINKIKCLPPTNIQISTEGIITWSESSNCLDAQYQLKIDGGIYENATNGIDKKMDIIATAGERNIYMKTNRIDNNYNDSDEVIQKTTVYKVELTKGTGIESVSGSGNYINNSQVSISAVIANNAEWNKWVSSDTGVTISTSNPYMARINSDWNYTANAKTACTMSISDNQNWRVNYSSSPQTMTLNGVSGEQGILIYSIKSQKNSSGSTVTNFSIFGSELVMGGDTASGVYTIVVNVTDTGNDIYSSCSKELTITVEVLTAGDIIKDKITSSSCVAGWVDNYDTSDTNDDVMYISGTNSCINFNYVWYSGKLWRITAIYPDGSMKLVTQNTMSTFAWGNTIEYNNSWIYQWLNQDFLDTLYDSSNIIKTSTWYYSLNRNTTSPARVESITPQKKLNAKVGLLNTYEVYNSYRCANKSTCTNNVSSSGYLKNGESWWLITPDDESISWVNLFSSDFDSTYSNQEIGVRPSIVINGNIKFNGDGTISNPYTIVGDKLAPTNTTTGLNTRLPGEYVLFNNQLYRIVGFQNNNTKILRDNPLIDSDNKFVKKYFASSNIYGKSSNTKSDDYWDYYLNNTWYNSLPSTYKNMIVDGTFYLGNLLTTAHYKATICKDSSLDNVTTKSCSKWTSSDTDRTFTGKVGLSRIGEYISSYIVEYRICNINCLEWFITPHGINNVYTSGPTYRNDEIRYAARPTFYLSSSVKIKGGNGTKSNPYVIGS